MRTRAAQAGVLVTLAFSTCPAAQQAMPSAIELGRMTMGYTYFNRPGSDLKTHDAEVISCVTEAARTISYDEQAHPGDNHGFVGAIIGGAVEAAAHRGAVASGLENCMVVRGWRVVKLPDDEGRALAKLTPVDLSARLAPWIGTTEPHGQIVRVWNNDAANAANIRFSLRPDHTNDGQLSLTEATRGDLHQFDVANLPSDSTPTVLDAKWPQKALNAQQLSSVPQGAAIVLVQITDASFHNGVVISFYREGTAIGIDPSRIDHAPDTFSAVEMPSIWHHGAAIFAFALPPGRWRVIGLGSATSLSFCLGSPSFEMAAGEVVYAGSFDLGAANIGPNLDLVPAKNWLGNQPQAQIIRPASYVNGSRGLCGGNAIYALEVKGAPFEPGYVWGSASATAAKMP